MDMIAGKEQMRRTGIDIIGSVPWGTHLCQFYQNKQDLIGILVPYFRQGLADNELCVWVTSEPLEVEEAKAALRAVEPALDEYIRRGQIEILDYTQGYTRTGRFNAGEVLQGLVDKLESALDRGYEGLRLASNTFWLEEKDWADFTAYEEAANRVIGTYRALAVCTYCLDRCGDLEIMDVLSNHHFALVKRSGRWQIMESSEHQKTKAALRESEERLNRAQEIAHLGSWELDLIHDELAWSDEVYRILGLEPQEFGATYEAFLERVHPEDRAAVEAAYWGSIREGRDSCETEHRVVRRNGGEIRWVYEKCQHVRDAEGQIVRSLGMVLDVTDRKQEERRISRYNGILRGINQIFEQVIRAETEEALGNACLAAALDVTGSEFGFVGEVGADGLLDDIAISDMGWDRCQLVDRAGHRRPPGDFVLHGLYGRVINEGKSLFANDPPFYPHSIGVPPGHPPLTCFLGVPLVRGGVTVGILAVANRKGGYSLEQQEDLEALAPAVVEALSRKRAEVALRQVRDGLELGVRERTAELREANERLRVENEARLRTEHALRLEGARLDALLHLSQLSEASIVEIAGFILERSVALTESKIGFVGFLNEDETVYTLHAVSKDVVKECNVTGDPVQWHVAGAGIWADAIRKRRTLIINDYSRRYPSKKGLPPGHPTVQRFMAVPVFDGKRIVAIAGVGNKATDYDSSDERQIALLLAGMWNYVQRDSAREALQKAHDDLEERVKQRTAELAESNVALEKEIAERKQAEKARQESRERLRAALDASGGAIYDHRVPLDESTYHDERWAELLGYSHSELPPYDRFLDWLFEQVHPEDVELLERAYNDFIEGKTPGYHVEIRLRHKQGHWVWVEGYSRAVERDESGRVRRVVGVMSDITDRKRTEEALRESEEQARWLARFPEENPNPVLRVSLDGTVLYRNAAAATTPAWQCQIAQPLPHEVLRRLVGQAIADGRVIERDVELGGTSFRVAVTPLMEERYANIYGRDITERKRAEKALRESEERARASAEELEAILDAAPVAIWMAHDPECRRVTGNAYADEVIMQTARGGNISASAAPGGDTVSYRVFRSGVELRPEDLPAQLAAATGKAVPAFEMELVFPDGRSVHLLAGGVPLFDAQGRVRGAVAAGLDVTLLKQTEAELQQLNVQLEQLVQQRTAALEASEARFRAIFEEAAIGIALADPEGRLMATNPALQRLLGYSEQELAGTRFPDLLGGGKGDAGELPRELLAGEGSVYTLEQQYTRKNGETGEANVIVSLLRRDTDASPLVLALVEDVTERKRAQEALIQAERLAVIGRMAASLAHEINNPIQSVVGCLGLATELLEEGQDAGQFMSVAMEELERAARIVRRMRDLGRREEGHKELAGVGELVEKVLILTHNQARNQQVEAVWEGGEELPPVPVVRDRIQQVFLNLVLNAIDALPRGGELRIRAARTDEPPGVQVSFADTGKGIPPDEVERLFEAFHSTKDLGLGLGLYVSRDIVQEHGGRIDVQSEVGQGTTFTVWLPAQGE